MTMTDRKHYLIKVTCLTESAFMIWYTDVKDGLLVDGDSLLMFPDAGEARAYAESKGIGLEPEESECSLFAASELPALVSRSGQPDVCNTIINAWNLFGDIAHSLGLDFYGDCEDGIVDEIYSMLFYGLNLPAMKHNEYHPVFDEEDGEIIQAVYESGLSILGRQFDRFAQARKTFEND